MTQANPIYPSYSVVGDRYTYLVTGVETNGAFAMFEAYVPAGNGSPPHVHHREDEMFYVIEGEFEFNVAGESKRLGAGDFSTSPLRSFLSSQGYDAHGWDLGFNFGPRDGVLKKSVARVMEIYETSGRKVSLIGWSLGGLYAREFAKALPKQTRNVITLGTPFSGDPKATNAWRFYEFVSGHKLDDKKMLAHIKQAPPMPTTSIFSRTDGVVAWPLSIQKESKTAENIEVIASHVGMGMNPIALYAVADRLAQPDGEWKKFDRSGWRQYFYRDPNRVE